MTEQPMTVTEPAPVPDAQVTARTDAKLTWALLWSYIFTSGGTLVSAVLQLGITAVIDPRSFGVMVLAMVWVSLALTLLQHGPTLAVIQQDDISDEHANAAFWVTMAGTVAFTAVFLAVTPAWAHANHLPELTAVCVALAPVVLLTGACAIPDAVIRRRMDMRNIAVRNLLSSLISGVVGLGCAIAGLGVWALVAQQLVAVSVYIVMLWFVTPWKPHRPRPRATWAAWRDLQRVSGQTLGGAVGNFAASRLDGTFMGLFFAPAAVGLYRFGTRFAEMIVDLTSRALQVISLPELARHNDNRAKLAARLGDLTHVAAVVTFPALAVLGACARPFVLVLGEQWAQAVQPLRVLCAVSAVGAVYDLIGPALQAAQRAAIPAIFTWVSAATYGAGFLAAVHLSSSLGTIGRITAIAWAVLAMRVALTIVLGYIAYGRILRVSAWPSVVAALPAVLASAVAVAVATGIQDLLGTRARPIVALILAGGLAALAAAAVLYAVDREVRTMAGKVLARIRQRTAARSGQPAPAAVLTAVAADDTADEATTVPSAD